MQNEDKQPTFMDNWRQGQLAKSSTASTIALSIILVATLCGAQLAIIKPMSANTKIYNAIKHQGLSKYLDQAESIHYYFEQNNRPTMLSNHGALLHHASKESGDGIEHTITSVTFYNQFNLIDELIINDNLRYYESKTYRVSTETGQVIEKTYQEMKNVELKITIYDNDNSKNMSTEVKHTIPHQLIDLFSSVGITTLHHESFLLKFTDQIGFGQTMFVYQLSEKEATSKHRPIMTTFQQVGHPEIRQDLLFDADHNLINQNNYMLTEKGHSSVRRSVPIERFLSVYPDALIFLQDWLERKNQ